MIPAIQFAFEGKADTSEFRKYLSDVQQKYIPAAFASTLTSSARAIRKHARKRIETAVGITPGESAKRLRIRRAKRDDLAAYLYLNANRVLLKKTTAAVNPFTQAKIQKKAIRYSKHSFRPSFVGKLNGKGAVWLRQGKRVVLAGFPMEPIGGSILEQTFEGIGAREFKRILADTLARKLQRTGDFSGEGFFETTEI